MRVTNWLVTLAVLAGSYASAADEYQAPPFTPSPVMQWGRPAACGTIRALFILQSAKQEAYEFMRRFDVQGQALDSSSGGKFGLGSTESSIARQKLASEPIDVCVIGGIYWKSLPATVRLAILEKVEQGMGLVWVDATKPQMDTTLPKLMAADPAPEAVAAVTNGIPIPLLPLHTVDPDRNAYTIYPDSEHPAPTPEQLVSGARFGKGRICLLHYSVAQSNVVYLYSLTPGLRMQDMPFTRPYPYWEYCHSLLGRAVRWAANRDPKVTVTVAAKPEGLQVGTVTVEAVKDGEPVELEVLVGDGAAVTRAVVTGQVQPVPGKPATLAVKVPPAKVPAGGLYFLTVQARRAGKVLDWATAAAEMPASGKLAVQLDRTRYAAEEPVKVTVDVQDAKPGQRVALSLTGTDGRLLGQAVQPAKATVTAQFSLRAMQTLVSYLEATLLEGDRVVWRERVPVFLAPGRPRQFFAYSWIQGETYYQRDYLRRLHDQGVDSVTSGGGAATYFCQGTRLASEMNLRPVPTNVVDSRIGCFPDTANLLRPLTDAKIIAEEDRRIRTNVPRVASLQPIGYSLMDEWALGTPQVRTDYGEASLAAFRKWLPTKYADLAALNVQWGTDFTSFDTVTPVTVEEIRQSVPQTPDPGKLNLSRFVDYRLFLDTVGPTAFAHFAEQIRELDPGAKVGLCGTESQSTWFGHEWWALSQALDFICGYGDASATPNLANFRGLQRELQRSYARPDSLLACWVGYGESDFYRDQALKLLLHGFHGIAYFSGEPMAYQDFPYLDYDFTLSSRALRSGAGTAELRQGTDQLIWNSRRDNNGLAILLSTSSLHVASALGTEGAWGEGCLKLARAVEDAGLQYDFVAPQQLTAGVLKERGYKMLLLPGATALSEAELRALGEFTRGGGKLLWDVPPGVMDEHGKGRVQAAGLVGGQVTLDADRMTSAAMMAGQLKAAGLTAPVTVTQGEANVPTEIIVHHLGAQRFVSLQTDVLTWSQTRPEATLGFGSEAFVYDMREGKFLGRTAQVKAVLDPMHILLYALLPYEVRGVQVSAGSTTTGQAANVKLGVQTSGGPAGTHFLRLTVTGPDGKPHPDFARTVEAKAGSAEAKLWFALNDPPGKWTVRARDAATGVTGQATLELRP